MKKLFYSIVAMVGIANMNMTNALTISNGSEDELRGGTLALDVQIAAWINTLTQFLTLIAVIYAIWGGFSILTAAGDEDKVKKGRTIIFHAILGLIVIWLAYSIIKWVVSLLVTGSPTI